MATPRVTQTSAPTGKALQDFPQFVIAREKLDDLQSQLDAARVDLTAAQQTSAGAYAERSEHDAAKALLSDGGGVAVATAPPIADLQRDVRIRTIAVQQQQQIVNEIAVRLERGNC